MAALGLGCGEQVGELVAVQPWLGAAVTPRSTNACGGVADVDLLVLEPREPRRQRGDSPPQRRVRQGWDLLLELSEVHLDMRSTNTDVRVQALARAELQPARQIAPVALAGVSRPEAGEERGRCAECILPTLVPGRWHWNVRECRHWSPPESMSVKRSNGPRAPRSTARGTIASPGVDPLPVRGPRWLEATSQYRGCTMITGLGGRHRSGVAAVQACDKSDRRDAEQVACRRGAGESRASDVSARRWCARYCRAVR
jgi:hypothetical protein